MATTSVGSRNSRASTSASASAFYALRQDVVDLVPPGNSTIPQLIGELLRRGWHVAAIGSTTRGLGLDSVAHFEEAVWQVAAFAAFDELPAP